MADSKSTYFGGGNVGLATILDSNKTEQTRQRLSLEEQRKVQQKVLDQEKRDKQAEQLKTSDVWRLYAQPLQEQYNKIVEGVKNGTTDPFTLRQELGDYAGKAQSTMQLKAEHEDALKAYAANKKILPNAGEWYLKSYHGQPTIDNLTKIQSEPLNPVAFLDEKGGSQYINPTESFNDVITKGLGGWIESEFVDAANKGKTVARGLMEFTSQNDTSKLKSFTEVDPKTGKIVVKDADKLIDSGVLTLFEADSFTNRILEDQTDRLIGNTEVTPEDRQRLKTQVLREFLQPYGSQGKVTSESKKDFRSYSVPSPRSGGSGSDDDSEARRIYDVFKSRSVGQGADVGESKTYTKQQVKAYNLPDSFVGKKYVESKALEGYKDEAGRALGRIIYREGDQRFGGVARIEVADKDGRKKWESLTLNQLETFLPRKVYDQVERLARNEGRIDDNGNFIYDAEDINNY